MTNPAPAPSAASPADACSRRAHLPLLCVAALLSSAAAASGATPPPDFSPERLSAMDKVLASDAFEGRGPATPAETKVIAYVTGQMQAAGLQPGGQMRNGRRSWTQDVPLLRASITDPKVSITSGGAAMPLTQGNQIAVRAALDGSHAVSLSAAPLLFVGYGIQAPERQWDDFKGVDVKGKILVELVNDPDFDAPEGSPVAGVFGGKAMTYYGRWTYKYEEAARLGAAGVLIVHETAPASYGWNTVKNSNDNAQFDIVRDDPKAAHTPMEAWIQHDLAVTLFRNAGLDFEAMKKAAQSRDFKPVDMKATLTAAYPVESSVITSHNIVGILPGTTHPDETVIYSAHWDHLGVGAPDAKGDRIYNGAVDNADGTAALIEMGRAFAHAPRTARSVVFLNVTAEEKGLLGSEYYATHPLYPLAKTAGVINMDALGAAGPAKNFSISGTAKLDLLTDLITVARAHGRSFSPDPHPEAGGFYRSDHFSFAKQGVPALSFDSGNDLVNGGVEAGEKASKDYTTYRYHQPADEWSPSLDFTGIAQDLGILYDLGHQLADSREWPNWPSDSEFRAARDKTAGERQP